VCLELPAICQQQGLTTPHAAPRCQSAIHVLSSADVRRHVDEWWWGSGWLVNGMQGVRGSNPLSSTPGQRPSQGPISSGSAASGSKSAAICLQGRSDRPTRPGAVGVIARSTRGHRAAGGSVVHDEGRIGWARQGRSKPRQRLILTRRVREDAFKLARARDDQLIGEVAVTVVVRSVPGSTVQCGA
jgi:hypothetical protein